MIEPMALLNDLTKCLGCRGCQVACKAWNGQPADPGRNLGSYENPPRLDHQTWTRITFTEIEDPGQGRSWVFTKRQCMHCLEPGCQAACPVGALKATPQGPVVYDEKKCIGCRYCMLACPFGVPRFEWFETLPHVSKCTMCADRLAGGLIPACVQTCPSGALLFGPRKELLALARSRIEAGPGLYVDHIFGEKEAGGCNMLYLSPVTYSSLGLSQVGTEPVARHADRAMAPVPLAFAGVTGILSGIYWLAKRREKVGRDEAGRDEAGGEGPEGEEK
jgi:formate dehydrogenase iron-sulfur subunit